MPTAHEQLSEQFYKWELRGRGWQVYDEPVHLEPPFVPFTIRRVPKTPPVDTGSRPSFLGSLVRGLGQKLATQPPPQIESEPEEDEPSADELPPWKEPQLSPEAELLRHQDGATVRQLVTALPAPFREAVVLRDINDLSYRDIAEVTGVPVGTVMSRLARARSMLRARWNLEEGSAP